MKEGRFVLGTFRSERMQVLYRSRQNVRLRVMLVLVHIDITPPHSLTTIASWHIPYLFESKQHHLSSINAIENRARLRIESKAFVGREN
ncbi:hypothetical protein TNCV_2359791 [Trichonephila clavipes]|nr:hypothetical protein TNCV_2359791 [Trichonephila clavipes]